MDSGFTILKIKKMCSEKNILKWFLAFGFSILETVYKTLIPKKPFAYRTHIPESPKIIKNKPGIFKNIEVQKENMGCKKKNSIIYHDLS